MGLVTTVEDSIKKELDRVSRQIEGELKAECPSRTGEARASIHIEETGEFERFVGGTNLHLYYADEGNKRAGGRIYPHGGGLAFHGWGKYAGGGHGKGGIYVLPSVSSYDGAHFVETVADRHR